MSERKINLEEINLVNNISRMISRTEQSYNSIEQMKEQPEWDACINAMKEACKQTLELAAENANTYYDLFTSSREINKQSILDTINQIE